MAMTQTARYRVQAIPADGLSYYNRGGRPWPRGGEIPEQFVEIEVVPDHMAGPPVRGIPADGEVLLIGETDFKVLQNDNQMRILSAPGGRVLPPQRPPLTGTPVAPARVLPPMTAAPGAPVEPVSVKKKPGPKPKTDTTTP